MRQRKLNETLCNERLICVADRSAILRWIGGAVHDSQVLKYRSSFTAAFCVSVAAFLFCGEPVRADSRGDDLAEWLNKRGQQVWGDLPELCSDLTFARRVYIDVIGRVPSVSELRDYKDLGRFRRTALIEQLVFAEGTRAESYRRLGANNFARQWQRVLVPPGTTTNGSVETIVQFLSSKYRDSTSYDRLMAELAGIQSAASAGNYFQLVGSSPESYAGHVSRVALGVRVECAQCHDHPFNDWEQGDFWGLAAFYGDLGQNSGNTKGSINYDGQVYPAKLLWEKEPLQDKSVALRTRLATWLTSKENPYFAATGVNRFWQHLVGRGLYADVENLDLANAEERAFLDEFGQRFADDGFDMQRLTAAICKSAWYQAMAVNEQDEPSSETFIRTLKVISPDQVFDSLEQSLLLPVSRVDPDAPRWTGTRTQLVTRLSETIGASPEDYASGIPQALMLMNGRLTSDAIDLNRSRLLRAVVESPFFNQNDRISTLYMAVLTREPSGDEKKALKAYLDATPTPDARSKAYGEILWALLNSPEFVLCR